MTKELKLKVKIFGNKYWYEVTELQTEENIWTYDPRDGNHRKFDWNDVEAFISENPELIRLPEAKNISSKPMLAGDSELLVAFFRYMKEQVPTYRIKDLNTDLMVEHFLKSQQ